MVSNNVVVRVPLSKVRQNPHALREVDTTCEEFLGIMANVEADLKTENGLNLVIDVRPAVDPVTQEEYYEVVDGGHRFVALKTLGVEEVNVFVMKLTDTEALVRQMTKNIHTKDTKHVELAAGIKAILATDKNCATVEDVAIRLKKSPAYIRQILKLNNIKNETIAKQINDGNVSINNAFALLKLPEKDQVEFLDSAIMDTNDVFKTKVNDHLKILKAERAKGEPGAVTNEFKPVKYLRNKSDIQNALANPSMLEGKLPAQSVHEAIVMTLEWVMCVDAESIEAQRAAWKTREDTKIKAREAKAKAKELEAQQKAAKAAEIAASAVQ